MKLTVEHFTAIDKRLSKIQPYLVWLNLYLPQFNINTWQRLSCFLAQSFHENDFLQGIEEYATGAAYEGRTELGNTIAGYGRKFKGRGFIHTTGFFNYSEFTKFCKSIGIDIDFTKFPERLKEPQFAVLSGIFYWNNKNLNSYADKLDFQSITKIVNGGLTHFDERKETWIKTLEICKQIIQS